MKRTSILLLLLFLAACTGSSGRTPEENIHTGIKGLTMTLEPVTPKVFEGDPFSIIGMISNDGAANVDNGVLAIGLEDDFVSIDGPRVRPIRLTGRSALVPYGETQTVRLDLRAKTLPSVTETVTSSVLLTMCYPYKTDASVAVCIDTDLDNKRTNKPCTLGAAKVSSGQGGPIAVSNVEEQMGLSEDKQRVAPMFTITVDNPGGGQVIAPDRVTDVCVGRPVENANHATLRAWLVDQELTCAKEGIAQVVFERQRNVIRCTLPSGIDKQVATYSSILRVELEYGYSTTISRSIQIVKG